jgi:hypothetical protein
MLRLLIVPFVLISIQTTYADDLPNPQITPGAVDPMITQQNIQGTVCVKGYWHTKNMLYIRLIKSQGIS